MCAATRHIHDKRVLHRDLKSKVRFYTDMTWRGWDGSNRHHVHPIHLESLLSLFWSFSGCIQKHTFSYVPMCCMSSLFISLQNIFLTVNGTIKLGDFGSACILNRYGNIKVTIADSRYLSHFVGNILQLKGLRSDICGDALLCGSRNLGKQAIQQ